LVREITQSRHLNFTRKREAEFRSRVVNILARLRATEKYEPAVEVAVAVTSLLGLAESSIQKGLAYQAWGEATLKAGTSPGGDISRASFELARARFRGAGDAFAHAANEQFNTTEYVPTLWSAIEAYQRGRHFSKSIDLLEKYLRYEERRRQPQGLVAHGRALLAEGQPDAAMESLQQCIVEFPRDPMRYEARLLAAQAAADSDDNEKAKALLQENLNDGQLTPQSPIWRDSLHTLGELMYAESNLAILAAEAMELPERIQSLRQAAPKLTEALRRLNEATERYWPSPRAQAASYLYARGQILAAQLPDAEMQVESLLDAAIRDFRLTSNRFRQTALDRFSTLVRYLDSEQSESELNEKQQAILRNSLLGQADTLKSMERYIEAADAYRDMSIRYMNEPPALEALLGQVRMVRLLGRDREAYLLLKQAGVVLENIDPAWDDRFDEMTRFDREGWERYLAWVNERNAQARGNGNPVR
jgi:tetratricopeptide (TPR) repeat protein